MNNTPTLVEILRGNRELRPATNWDVAPGLRAVAEDGLFALTQGQRRESPLIVTAREIARTGGTHMVGDATFARLRGALVAQIVRLWAVQEPVVDPTDDALCALIAQNPRAHELTRTFDDDDWARLRADVSAHTAVAIEHLGRISPAWRPRTGSRARVRLAGGDVLLHDTVDVVVGSTQTERASVALLDVTTSPLGEGLERVARYHALVETLRTGAAPLRVVMFSTATAERWSFDVDSPFLHRALADVLDVVETAWGS